jgi:hypothetical protein
MILLKSKYFSFFDSVTGELKAEFRSGAGKRRFERWKNEIIDNLSSTYKNAYKNLGGELNLEKDPNLKKILLDQDRSRRIDAQLLGNSEYRKKIRDIENELETKNKRLEELENWLHNAKVTDPRREKNGNLAEMKQLKKRIEYLNNTLKGSRTTSPVYEWGKQKGVESLDVTKLNNEKAGWNNYKLESDLSGAKAHNSYLERNIANLNKKLEEEIEKGSKNNLQLTQELEELREKARKGEIDLEDQTRELNKLKDKYNKDIEKSQADLNESNKRMKIISGVGAGLGVTGLGYGFYKGMQKPDQK